MTKILGSGYVIVNTETNRLRFKSVFESRLEAAAFKELINDTPNQTKYKIVKVNFVPVEE